MSLIRLYTAGPYRAYDGYTVEDNLESARIANEFLWTQGLYYVLSPHCLTAPFDGLYTDDEWLQMDLEFIRSGAVQELCLLPRWTHSFGACAEREVAEQVGIEIWEYEGPTIERGEKT